MINWVDIFIILFVLAFAVEGHRRGFFLQLVDILSFTISLIFSLMLFPKASELVTSIFKVSAVYVNPISFILIWITTELIFLFAFSSRLKKLLFKYKNSKLNKYFGFVPASLNSIILLSFIFLFVVSLPLKAEVKKDIFTSKIASNLINGAYFLEEPLSKVFGPLSKQGLTFLTVKPEDKHSINLGYTQNNLSIDYQSEQAMFDLVNNEREKVKVKKLEWDFQLTAIARNHSEDMFRRGYFSHYSPEGKDVGDRIGEILKIFTVAGENLALAPDTNHAHQGLMNSPGHKRNILDPTYTKIGIGIIDGGIYGKMVTQVFTN